MNKQKVSRKEQGKEKYSGRNEEMFFNTPLDKLKSFKSTTDEDSVFYLLFSYYY